MRAVTGVFVSRADGERVVEKLKSTIVPADRVTLLAPGERAPEKLTSVPVDTAERPGIGKAIGAVVGGAAGLSSGFILATIPAVGAVNAFGLLGAAILTAAGTTVGAVAGNSLENSMSRGLPEDEIFVYEDALRKGRTVVIALAEDADQAASIREVLDAAGAETLDAAREQWWIGLRSAEREHYASSGHGRNEDEQFYRLGFEAALHARRRCQEFDQVSAEMASALEDVRRQYPNADVDDLFTRGYQRGREYYERLCDQSKAA